MKRKCNDQSGLLKELESQLDRQERERIQYVCDTNTYMYMQLAVQIIISNTCTCMSSIQSETTWQILEPLHALFIPFNDGFVCTIFNGYLHGRGFNYTVIFRKSKQAMTLIFAIQLHDI